MNNEKIEYYLTYDAILEAERITKAKFDTDSLTQRVAAANFIVKVRKLSKELKNGGDTWRGMKYMDFVNIVLEQGFRPVHHENFTGENYGSKPCTEMFMAFYHETKGIFVVAESFGSEMVNKAEMYYNWVPNQLDKEWTRATSSGGFEKSGLVWAGHHQVNEALKYKLDLLHKKGYFVQQWVENPHVWLLNYMEVKNKDLTKLNDAKLKTLPDMIKKWMVIK